MATDFGSALPIRNSPQTGEELKVVLDNGTDQVAIKPASTAAVATDKALVVAVSPNNSLLVAQPTAADLNATVVQATAANLNATVVQGTATNLKAQAEAYQGGSAVATGNALFVQPGTAASFTVAQGTAASLNATVVQATAANLKTEAHVSDGSNTAAVKAASTAAIATDPALVVAVSPNNTVTVGQSTFANLKAQVEVTDGSNTAAVKAASTAAIATDPALVVAISPNNTLNVNLASSNPTSGQTTHYTTADLAASAVALEEFIPSAWPFFLDSVWSTASGKHKLEVWTNAASLATPALVRATGTQLLTGFGTASNPNVDKAFSGHAKVLASNSIYLILTNTDNQTQAIYATVGGNA